MLAGQERDQRTSARRTYGRMVVTRDVRNEGGVLRVPQPPVLLTRTSVTENVN